MSPQSKSAVLLPRPELLHRPVRRVLTALVAGGVFVTGSGVAFADNVYNTLDASIDATAEAMSLTAGGPVGTTQLKIDNTNGDGKQGCNLTGGTTLKLALASSASSVATVSPAEVTFASCGEVKDLTVTGLAAGSAGITATQVYNDTGAAFDLTPVKFTVTVAAASTTPTAPSDTTAPDAPTIDLHADSDSGASSTDDLTNDSTPTLTGTAEVGSTVEVFNGTTALGTTSAVGTDGKWTFTPSELTSGRYSFTAKAKDAAGNVSAASSALVVTIDTAAPALPTINLVDASDTGASATDNVTADSTPTLDGTAEAGSQVDIFDGTTFLKTVTASASGAWSATTGVLEDGSHTLTSQSTDAAGNFSQASLALTVVTDTAAPATPTVDLAAASDSGASDSDNVTNQTALVLDGTAEKGSTVKVYDGNVLLGSTTADAGTGSWSFTTAPLSAGARTITASATDAAGNVSAAVASLEVTIDATAPDRPSINLVDASDTGVSNTDNVTSDSTPTLDGLAEPGSEVKVFNGTQLLSTVTATSAGTWSATTGVLLDGVHTLTSRATDLAGNASQSSLVLEVEIDTVAPDVPTIDLADASDSGASATDNVTNDDTPTFSGTASTGSTVKIYKGDSVVGSVNVAGGTWSFTSAALADGAHSFTAAASDTAGNTSAASSALSMLVDTTAPVAVYTSADREPNTAGWYKDNVTATFTVTDSGSQIQQGDAQVASVTRTATTSGEGSAVTVNGPVVTDLAGNSSNVATSAAYKIDKTAPTVALVSTIVDGSSYPFGTVPAQPTCDASDGLSLLASCTITGYSTAVGTHTVTATAKDNAGNIATVSRQYTVAPWTTKGFYQPVDMAAVNTAKAGSTIPLKFEVFQGNTELTDTAAVKSLTYSSTVVSPTAPVDEIETLASGSTALRFDSTSGQFVYNWKTPAAGSYRLTVTLQDGSTIQALFKLR